MTLEFFLSTRLLIAMIHAFETRSIRRQHCNYDELRVFPPSNAKKVEKHLSLLTHFTHFETEILNAASIIISVYVQ